MLDLPGVRLLALQLIGGSKRDGLVTRSGCDSLSADAG